jgi:outer membrane murein-binding lipoprotein Lpp
MNRSSVHAAGAALLAALVAGCVSKGDYEKLETDKNAEIATLKKDKTALEQQKTSLEQQQAESRKQIDALEQEKAKLATASQQDKSQYDALVRNLTDEVKRGELQVRQYKDMLTVDVA